MMRQAFHLTLGSLVPLLGLGLPQMVFLPLLGIVTLFSLSFDLARWHRPNLNHWFLVQLIGLKPQERHGLNGASYLLLAALIAFLAFEAKVAALALLFLSLGDPAAAGKRWGWHRIKGKSMEGSLAFLASALALALILASPLGIKPWVAATGAGVATLLELLPLPVDDNFIVPIGATLVLFLLSQA